MKLVWKCTALIAVVMFLGACQNGPTQEEINLMKAGASATLINQPDPEEEKMKDVIKQYDEYIKSKFQELDLPGLAYAIVKDGQVVSMKTYGVRKKGKKDQEEPIDEHTAFRLASVSKGFGSVVAGVMVDQGYFGWDDKIVDLIPNFKLRKEATTNNISLRHTLSHTTGLVEYSGSKLISKELSMASIIRGLRSVPIEAKLEEKFAYQNAIYSTISEVARRTTKLNYEELMDSLIFKPLGMEDASASYKSMRRTENKAMPHTKNKRKGWVSGKLRTKWYNVGPAAGINASIADMGIWLQAMLGHRSDVIPQSVLDEIFEPHIAINDDSKYYETWHPGLSDAYYGMGWRILNYNNNKIVYHGGWLKGYRPEMGFCPKEDVGVVFLTNADKNDLSTACVRAFFDMYFAPKVIY